MAQVRRAEAEPIPGYRLLQPLGKGGFGEVWKCEAPGGLNKAVKFVRGAAHVVEAGSAGVEQELRALERIRSIRHPFLLSMDRIEIVNGELVIVMELADQSLHDYFQHCRSAGLPGIPRNDLLNYLQEAAEALDLINIRHGLQHLDIKPRNLLLVSSHVKVADFGLLSSLAEAESATRQQLAAGSPVYASPEVFQGKFSSSSDQYSLAMAYHELLTGELPLSGKNYRQLAMAHLQAEPNLQALPEADRAVVARALAKEPSKRFPSCGDFVQALLTAPAAGAAASPSARQRGQVIKPLFGSSPGLPGQPSKAPATPKADAADECASPERARAMRSLRALPAALSEYQFQDCLDRSELSEIWMAEAPSIGPCIVKFMYGLSELDASVRANAVQRMAALNHPALVPGALARSDASRLVLVTPRLGPTLRERWQKAKNDGGIGIPRAELLATLRDAAQTLDVVAQQDRVAHLSLSPDNLQLVPGRTLIADHGLASFFWLPAGQPLAAGNARYAPAELWGNAVSQACDSYSLAVIYQEMLTGRHPFASAGARNQFRIMAKPDLLPLPERDRAVIQQALDRTPSRRFATCSELIAALEAAGKPGGQNGACGSGKSSMPQSDVEFSLAPVARLLHDIIACASNGCVLQEHGTFRYLLQPGQLMRHSFVAKVAARTLPLKLEPFVQQWQAQLSEQSDDMAIYRVPAPGDGRSGLKARNQGFEVTLNLRQRPTLPPPLVEVRIHIKPFGSSALSADVLLRQTGPAMLESLRGILQAHPERRAQDRLPYEEAVTVWPLDQNGVEQMPIRGQGKDLSRSGLGLYLPRRPPSDEVRMFLSQNGRPVPVPVSARIVRVETRGDRVEVGTMFCFDSDG